MEVAEIFSPQTREWNILPTYNVATNEIREDQRACKY